MVVEAREGVEMVVAMGMERLVVESVGREGRAVAAAGAG